MRVVPLEGPAHGPRVGLVVARTQLASARRCPRRPRYAAGTREILVSWFAGRPIREEY
ncbi:hypothetical protein N4G69_26400 [Streptomyces mirabilis]|nr:hypothetical protein [Streptomyces mirabilis]MCT9109100.1 hypothetical protein [Streptomyces mirabilis]